MGRLTIRGLDQLIADMEAHGDDIDGLAERMCLAAGETMKQKWEFHVLKEDLIDKGDLFNSIGYPPRSKTRIDQRTIETYPRGKNRRGVRNAEVAFIHHYGAPKRNIKARHFVDRVETDSEDVIPNQIEQMFDSELKKRGL